MYQIHYNFIEEDLIAFLREGKSCVQIAKIYGVDRQIIQRRVRKLKLPNDIYIKQHPSNKKLSKIEFNVLIGGLLGDTWIGYSKKGKNACGSFTHKLEHSEYVHYKYNLMKRLCAVPTIHNKYDKRTDRFYQQSFCKIATNPLLNNIVNKFYENGIKKVDRETILKLSPLGIAIWFMDDGTKTIDSYRISTDCFSETDREILLELLKTYDLDCTKTLSKQIYIKKNSRDKFTKLIKKYVCNCMKYKLHI